MPYCSAQMDYASLYPACNKFANFIITQSPVIFTPCDDYPKKEANISSKLHLKLWCLYGELFKSICMCVCVCARILESEKDVCVGISPRPFWRNLLPPVLRQWVSHSHILSVLLKRNWALWVVNWASFAQGCLIGGFPKSAYSTHICFLSWWGLSIDFCWFSTELIIIF